MGEHDCNAKDEKKRDATSVMSFRRPAMLMTRTGAERHVGAVLQVGPIAGAQLGRIVL